MKKIIHDLKLDMNYLNIFVNFFFFFLRDLYVFEC